MCGIRAGRISKIAPDPVRDGRVHLVCNRCGGYLYSLQDLRNSNLPYKNYPKKLRSMLR